MTIHTVKTIYAKGAVFAIF